MDKIDARKRMEKWREEHGIELDEMARKLEVSEQLLIVVENGSYTHPSIARRIQELVGLTDEETAQLVSADRIKNKLGEDYHWKTNRIPVGALTSDIQELEYFDYVDTRHTRRCKA